MLSRLARVFVIAMALGTGGCLAAAHILPVVAQLIAEVVDGSRKLEALEAAGKAWFDKNPDPASEARFQDAIDKAQAALDVALKAAHGAESMAEGDRAAAIQSFVEAWQVAAELAMELGFVRADGSFAAGPQMGVVIEPPLAVQRAGAAP